MERQQLKKQMAKDVVTFLAWAAEPHLEARHKTGFRVIIYLIIITILVYFSMKKFGHVLKRKFNISPSLTI